jgi:hypothetical protein
VTVYRIVKADAPGRHRAQEVPGPGEGRHRAAYASGRLEDSVLAMPKHSASRLTRQANKARGAVWRHSDKIQRGIEDVADIFKAHDPGKDPSTAPVLAGAGATAGLAGMTGYRGYRAGQNKINQFRALMNAEGHQAGSPLKHAWMAAANKVGENAKLHAKSGGKYGLAATAAGIGTLALASRRGRKKERAAQFRRGQSAALRAARKNAAARPVLAPPQTKAVGKAVDFSADERRHLADIGHARPGGRFPIPNGPKGVRAVKSATHLLQHASATDKAFIRRRVNDLGMSMPDSLKSPLQKYDLPGDNPAAERARGRKKAGLGAAGVGYLAVTRTKDVSPAAMEAIGGKPKGAGEAAKAAHEAKLAARAAKIDTLSRRGGAALVAGGLLTAGEGLVSDWRHRRVVQRNYAAAKKKVNAMRNRNQPAETPTPVLAKAMPGWVVPVAIGGGAATAAIGAGAGLNEYSRRHANKRGAGVTVRGQYLRPYQTANKMSAAYGAEWANKRRAKAEQMVDSAKKKRVLARANRNAYSSQFGRAAAKAGPWPLAGVARGYSEVGPYDKRKHYAAAQPVFSKAYDPERQRHRRQNAYEGATTGGALVAGGGAGYMGRRAWLNSQSAKTEREHAKTKSGLATEKLDEQIARKGGALKSGLNQASDLGHQATKHAQEAKRLRVLAGRQRGGAIGLGATAAGLAATAYGVHRHDQKSGRSYPAYGF